MSGGGERREHYVEDIIKRYVDEFNANDEETHINDIDNAHAYEWMKAEIPIFECPDKAIEQAYYFRWWTYRKHIKSTPEGRIVTEFLPDVPWSGKYNSINAAVGHHISEGRWLKSSGELLGGYIRHFLSEPVGGHKYSAWLIWAAWQLCLTRGSFDMGKDFIERICEYYEYWEREHGLEGGMFWSIDNYDAMEYSISGTDEALRPKRGIRPTLNSYMCADAWAISRFADVYGETEIKEKYLKKHLALKDAINEELWENGFYRAFHYCDGEVPEDVFGRHAGEAPRELIGYIPWMFRIPPAGREGCFTLLEDEKCFFTPYGLATAEKSNERFLYEVDHECLWNGYVWPFATSQTLTALDNVIRCYPGGGAYKDMYFRLLRQYAESHVRVREDGKTVPWIDEVRHPLKDDWSSRTILRDLGWQERKGGYERGKDYNHSTFCDLVISGLVGARCSEDGLSVEPNIPQSWDSFKLLGLHCLGKVYDITFTRGEGLRVSER